MIVPGWVNSIRFEPIPKTSPIPRNVVAYIGGITAPVPTFVLMLNGQEIVIQAPSNPPGCFKEIDPEHPFFDYLNGDRQRKIFAHYLEIIQTLINAHTIGSGNWAYLIHQGSRGGYQLVSKSRTLLKVTCPPWARLIHESEVEYTVFGGACDRRGIWQGLEVDVMIGWMDDNIKRLDMAMYGYRALEGLNFTYEVYGHLIGSDGNIIGIVTEAAWGHMARVRDRPLIYQAIARLQSLGYIYKACIDNRFMIANGKVRLLDVATITSYRGRRDELETDAEFFHWDQLNQLFWEFDHIGPYGDWRIPFARFTTSYRDLDYLPLTPSPDVPLGGIMLHPGFFEAHNITPWSEYRTDEDAAAVQDTRTRPARNSLLYSTPLLEWHRKDSDKGDNDDAPLRLSRLQIRSRHGRRQTHHPYQRRGRDTQSNSDNTSVSSISDV